MSPVRQQLLETAKVVVSALATAVVSIGFVAFVGAAILWTRFHVAELPADQAVAVTPREQLVVIGATALVLFALLGAAAALGVYLLDRKGRATRRMVRGLVALGVVQLAVAIVLADFPVLDAVLLVVGFALAGILLSRALAAGTSLAVRVAAALPVAIAFAVLCDQEPWLGQATGVVLVLGLLNLAAAAASGERFLPLGFAVVASVAVFGAFFTFARAVDAPRVQAAAVLRSDDPRGGCALYVTETDDRLYLARVDLLPGATDTKPRGGSGRLFWVPKDKLVSWSIGPLQSISRAQDQALVLRDELVAQRPPVAKPPGSDPKTATAAAAGPVTDDPCSPRGARAAVRETQERALARKYQPILSVDKDDRFWPVSVRTVFGLRGGRAGNTRTCLKAPGTDDCDRLAKPGDLPWIGATNEWVEFPGKDFDERDQARTVRAALGAGNPYTSAQMYFLVAGRNARTSLTSLQYWFFYPFNYQRLQGVGARAGFHEGDFESVGVLLSASGRPAYVWTARHGSEGERFAYAEPGLAKAGEHVRVHAARGSHATYATCGRHHRPLLRGAVDDQVACPQDTPLVFEPHATPLADLALAPWTCFQGRFGHSIADQKLFAQTQGAIIADGPRTPLWQQRFGRGEARPCEGTPEPPGRDRDGGAEETSDDVTAQRLRDRAGALAPLFDSCVSWQQRPTQGAYVSACDPAILDRWFRSRLDDAGPERLRIAPPRGRGDGSIPALLRSPDPAGADGARITSSARSRPEVYVARYRDGRSGDLFTAAFPAVTVTPDRSVCLEAAGVTRWRLRGCDDGRTLAEARPALLRPGGPPGGAGGVSPGADMTK